MNKTVLGLLAGMILSSVAQAGDFYIHSRLGNYDYWNGSHGRTISGQRIGNTEFYHDWKSGQSWTVTDLDPEEDDD